MHFDIEDRMKKFGLFYERRKNHYRNQKKPINQVVSITELAQAVMAILMQVPNESRARPQTFLGREDNMESVFPASGEIDVYPACVLLDNIVHVRLRERQLSKDNIHDIRFYADMVVAATLVEFRKPTRSSIAGLLSRIAQDGVDMAILDNDIDCVVTEFNLLGGNDKVAKGTVLRDRLIRILDERFPSRSSLI